MTGKDQPGRKSARPIPTWGCFSCPAPSFLRARGSGPETGQPLTDCKKAPPETPTPWGKASLPRSPLGSEILTHCQAVQQNEMHISLLLGSCVTLGKSLNLSEPDCHKMRELGWIFLRVSSLVMFQELMFPWRTQAKAPGQKKTW